MKEQRRMILMEQLRSIKRELGLEKDDKSSLIDNFRKKWEPKQDAAPEEVRRYAAPSRAPGGRGAGGPSDRAGGGTAIQTSVNVLCFAIQAALFELVAVPVLLLCPGLCLMS
jgi:hypothetical protein